MTSTHPPQDSVLNENQQHRLIVTCRDIDRLIADLARSFAETQSTSPFGRYANDLAPVSRLPLRSFGRARERAARVMFKDGGSSNIRVDELHSFVTEAGNPRSEKNVATVELFHLAPLLATGLCLVDTPGLGSVFEANTEENPHVCAAHRRSHPRRYVLSVAMQPRSDCPHARGVSSRILCVDALFRALWDLRARPRGWVYATGHARAIASVLRFCPILTSPLALTPGTRLGPYEIVSALGAGGMGEVYRARDPRLDRQVAIKLLPTALGADSHARERLRREAMAVAALDHPYICKIFEIGEDGDALFLVMEYIAGTTLHQRLLEGRMPLPDALRLAGEIADALQEAHAGGFLHRDLKPSNVMLTPQGHVKVMDFGLAKRVEVLSSPDTATREMGGGQLTVQGTIVGTPDYMSPEQVKGSALDVRSDLFSFGVMLAEMTSGRHPFRQPSTMETFSAVLREPPALGGDIPRAVMILLRRLLAKDVEERYASVADMRADLARLDVSSGAVGGHNAGSGRTARWRRLAVGGTIVLLLGAAATGLVRSGVLGPASRGPEAVIAPGAIRSIAVLPLDNYSGDPNQDYFAEGMTDELTADLATISQLRVISRGSVMQFKGDRRPPTPEIARMLNVDAIVEGSVRRVGDNVRITAQLIDARADRHLWARTFERTSRDVLALQDELASAIAGEINVQLTPTEKSRLAAAPSVNPEAYDAYLKGRYFFNRPSDENLKKAIAQFEETVRLSPNFAPAYSGLSDAYLWAGYNEGVLTGSEARPKAKATAEKAVQLDDNSAEAHTSLAVFKLFYEYDWAGSEREFRRAIALNPNYAFAHDQFGLGLAFQGRLDEAMVEGKRAIELDPLSPQIRIDHALPLMFQGSYGAAKDQARKAAELDPTYYFPPMLEGWVDIQEGKFNDAIPSLKKAKALDSPAFVTAWLAYAYAASGDRTRAMGEIDDLEKRSLRGEVLPFNLAIVHLGLGDRKLAIDYLERAYASDSQWMGWLKMDRMFDPLRSEPRFVSLMRKLRLAP